MQIGVERPLNSTAAIPNEKTMTNDKVPSPTSSQEHYGQDVYQRSLSESEYIPSRAKRPRYDPLPDTLQNVYESKKYHRLIEKRRRDRINECIYQLKDLLPTDVIKSTSKPMEKAVILELVVKYMQSINRNGKDGRSPEYVRGYKECTDKVFGHLNSSITERQKEELKNHLQQEMIISSEARNGNSQPTAFSPTLSTNTTNEAEESGRDKQSRSSSSWRSSSPMSDFSLCADYSDSSGCQDEHKFPKKKFYSHHHHAHNKTNNSNQVKRQQVTSTPNVSSQGQAPVFINMPFMMTPNMMPTQFMSADGNPMNGDGSMPRMMQSFPMSTPTAGMMMPQMATDNNGVQFPSFFMSCGPQSRTDNQQQQQNQNTPVETVMMQPTMMMPMRNQGNFVFMPSYPMVPQFQTPTIIPMQTSTEEQTSPSE